MISEIVGVLGDVLGMVTSAGASNEYADELDKLRDEQKISRAAKKAESIYREQATQGLPGYESMREEIQGQTPMTLGQAQDWLTSGGVADFLAKSQASTNQQLRQLSQANEQTKMQNQTNYAQFMGGPMAAMEASVLQNQTQLGAASAYMDYDKSAKQTDYWQSMFGRFGGMADQDWSDLAALFSKKSVLDGSDGMPKPGPADGYVGITS